MFTPEFEANPNDKELVSRIVRLLSDAECFKEDLFLKTVETLHNLDPSYKSAEYLYKLYSSRGEDENAIKMLREAIDSEESTDAEDADYLITLASFYFQNMKNLIKASEAAKEAMSKNPAVAGKAYMILGSIWTQVTCGGDDIQQRSKWWVAVDYFTRAKNADASLAEEAQKHIDTYYQYFPLKEDAFIFGLKEGDSYTVSCNGLSAVTRVRTRLK
ncbi:MAG: transposase, partial [Bacteroidales bacterium]|nr:transposase [Bacteroidales bacterium]